MRKDFGAKPLCYPMPVYMVSTYDENGKEDIMNAGWGGITNSSELTLCLSAGHKTVKNLKKTGAFTVSIGDASHVIACDYVGLVSANNTEDKIEKSGFTFTKSEKVNAPIANELAICLECEVASYDDETHKLVGNIINVSVDDSVITDGKVDVAKAAPITFDPFNREYYVFGEKVGDAFKSGMELK